jgi:uncharacterized phage infection (PIP) family protein YhgE
MKPPIQKRTEPSLMQLEELLDLNTLLNKKIDALSKYATDAATLPSEIQNIQRMLQATSDKGSTNNGQLTQGLEYLNTKLQNLEANIQQTLHQEFSNIKSELTNTNKNQKSVVGLPMTNSLRWALSVGTLFAFLATLFAGMFLNTKFSTVNILTQSETSCHWHGGYWQPTMSADHKPFHACSFFKAD